MTSMQFVFVLLTTIVNMSISENVSQAFKTDGVSPDLISEVPEKLLEVKYTKIGENVKLGKHLTPTEVKEAPEIKYDGDDKSYYTLIMTDPDVPSRKNPTSKEFLHWLVVNIPGSKIANGEVISEYVGSGPPKNSGLHRYVFLLYRQPEKLTFDEPHHSDTDGKRDHFSTENFIKKYSLGKPIAGNFFQAEYDDSVPGLYKQLGF